MQHGPASLPAASRALKGSEMAKYTNFGRWWAKGARPGHKGGLGCHDGGARRGRCGTLRMEFSEVTEFGHVAGLFFVSKTRFPCFSGAKRAQIAHCRRNVYAKSRFLGSPLVGLVEARGEVDLVTWRNYSMSFLWFLLVQVV